MGIPDKALIEMMIADLQLHSEGIDLFSKEYFFDKKNAEHRSKIAMLGGPLSHRSRLSILLREGMTDDHRAKIFDGKYQLGNLRTLPKELCSMTKLADEWYGPIRSAMVANDAFETIKNGIESITGKKLAGHFSTDKSTTLKVMNTLHSLTQRESRLIQQLRSPTFLKKFSMSFRDAYPYEKNQDQVWLIADLKAYLSAELSEDRFNDIGFAYENLREWKDYVLQTVERSLFLVYSRDYQSMVSAYSGLTKVIEDFRFEAELNHGPLDEVLFTYIHGLEDAHFYAGYREMVSVAIPSIAVTPVWKELRKWANGLGTGESEEVDETDERIKIRDVPLFAAPRQNEISAIMETALGRRLEPTKFGQMTVDACNLMRTEAHFGRNGKDPMRDDSTSVSLLYIVAAFCCVWYSARDSTNYKPYWHGQPNQSGSINASNRAAQSFRATPVIDSIPEEHRHLWAYRLEWFVAALRGHRELTEQKFAFRSAIATLTMKILTTNNPDCFAQIQSNFDKFLSQHLPRPNFG